MAAFDGEIARPGRAGAQHRRVKFLDEIFRGIILSDFRIGDKHHALLRQQVDAALEDVLVELHIRDAVHQQSADAVRPLEYRHRVARLVQLRRRAQACRAGTDHRDRLAGARLRRLGCHPALVPTAVDDGDLDVFDRDGRLVDAQHAGTFARGRADTARKLGEIVCLVQSREGLLPQPAVDQVIPLGDQVADGAARRHAAEQRAGMAKRDAAIHAARALLLEFLHRHVQVKLLPVANAFRRRAVRRQLAFDLQKSSWFAHGCLLTDVKKCQTGQNHYNPRQHLLPVPTVSSVLTRQFPPTRARSWAFCSKAAMIASSPLKPVAFTRCVASMTRL